MTLLVPKWSNIRIGCDDQILYLAWLQNRNVMDIFFCNFTLCQSSFGKHQEGATGSNFAIPFQYHLIKIICICRWSPGPNLSIIGKQCFLNIREIQGRGDIISEKRKKNNLYSLGLHSRSKTLF